MVRRSAWQADLYDLIAAYGIVRARTEPSIHVIARRPVMTLDEAIHRLERMIGAKLEWTALEAFLPETQDPEFRRSALASSFVATLGARPPGQGRAAAEGDVRDSVREGGMRELADGVRAVEACLVRGRGADGGGRASRSMSARASTSRAALAELEAHYAGRGVELVERGGRWHFQTAADLAHILRREREESRKLSPRRGRDAGDHRLSRAGQPRRDRGDQGRADLQGARWTC